MSRGEERSLITGWGIIDPTNELCDRIHYFYFCSHPWLLDPFLVWRRSHVTGNCHLVLVV